MLGDPARGLDPTSSAFAVLRPWSEVSQQRRDGVDRCGLATDQGVIIELLDAFVSTRCRPTALSSDLADRSLVGGEVLLQFRGPVFEAVEATGQVGHVFTGVGDR